MANTANEQLAVWGRINQHLEKGRLSLFVRRGGGVVAYIPTGDQPEKENRKITFYLEALQPYVHSMKNPTSLCLSYTPEELLAGFSNNIDFLYKLWNTEIPGAAKLIFRRYESPGIVSEITIDDFLRDLHGSDMIALSIDEPSSKEQRYIEIRSQYNPKMPLRMALSTGDYLIFKCPWDPIRAEGYRNFVAFEEVFKSVYGMDIAEYHNKVNVPYRDIARKKLMPWLPSKTG